MVGTPSNSSILRIVVVGLCVLAPTLYIHMVFSTFVPCDQRVDQRFMRRKQLKPFIPINSSQHLRYRRQQAYYYLGCTRRTYSTVGISFQRNALSLSLSEQQHVSFGYLTLDFRYDPPFLLVAPRIVYLNLRAGLIGMRQLRGAEPIIYCTGRHQFRDISNGIMNVILRFLVTLSSSENDSICALIPLYTQRGGFRLSECAIWCDRQLEIKFRSSRRTGSASFSPVLPN